MPKIVATKEDWIKLGYEYFSESGENGLIVEKMSDKLDCNKSSFYWHFKNKENFIKSIVEYWENHSTKDIIQKVLCEKTFKDKFDKLIELSFHKDVDIGFIFYLKKYAQSDEELKKVVDHIDKERIEFTKEIICGLGYTECDAELKAQVFYKYLIGYHEMIRYKPQKANFLTEVRKEINQFINIEQNEK